jgi:anaerobic selenocysteine-containing dehydrogenase/Fe-S-cluster-containing dehydrogenase component
LSFHWFVFIFSLMTNIAKGTKLSRRQFLKAAGLTGAAALIGGCSDATRKLIPFLNEPEDIVPGKATWYASTCRECPAGCGILAKNRDGRVIKVEGNPLHPVNTGKLCPRGQASVQGIYDPDRYRGPLRRLGNGILVPVSWGEAERTALSALSARNRTGRSPRVAFITDLTTGAEQAVIRRFLASIGSGTHIIYEPLAYESLRQANDDIFGIAGIPSYRLDNADLLVSFGANFLETWISNVQFARQFAAFRKPSKSGKKPFLYVGPRLSLTAVNADHWVSVPPGGESLVARCLLHLLLKKNYAHKLGTEETSRLSALVSAFTPEFVADRTGVRKETLNSIATVFTEARQPLALAEGLGYQDPQALETARAANILNTLHAGWGETIDFSHMSNLSQVAPAKDMKKLAHKMNSGEIDALFILRANPVYHLPPEWEFSRAIKTVPLVVTLSSFPDETSELAHLVMPSHTFLESWGDYSPWTKIRGFMQPVMGPVFDTRHAGDILLSIGRTLKGAQAFPEKDFFDMVRNSLKPAEGSSLPRGSDEHRWQKALQQGGVWQTEPERMHHPVQSAARLNQTFSSLPEATVNSGLSFISYPTLQFFDGRLANRPFLKELPDPITCITWDGWIEIHPETAEKLKIENGDLLTLRSESENIEAPAYIWPGIRPHVLAMPIGYGQRALGRFCAGKVGSAAHISSAALNGAGGVMRPLVVAVSRTGKSVSLAHTDGDRLQHGRGIARSMTWRDHISTLANGPEVVLPLPEGFSRAKDFYAAHSHDTYRWGMAVDLDRCIGCGACVIACYAENNIAVVGRKEVLRGREMAWLHIQRYLEESEPFVRFLPMLCQHCDEAPCEAVCPVFAPHHSPEGVNNQVYNRCIGTRFCSQNCPYKVRRFNWFKWERDSSLDRQLNPDVTVRTKGVMEKCSFCIQRINAARIKAKSENRLIRDGDFAPACVQTCPVDALVFGNLKDPGSAVSDLARQARAYQVLGDLNTKPAVIYLKKIRQQILPINRSI